jgi:patatin-like phospholipase/acyl hydrolase
MKPILILSIDGGGLRGVVPLTILAEVQRRLNPAKEMWQCFDLIAGTSTGGLITSALTLKDEKSPQPKAKYSINDILNVYLGDGHIIFPPQKGLNKLLHDVKDIARPKFDEAGIEKIFRKVLGNYRISDCLTNIMVSTYDLNNNIPLFFKSIDNKMNNNLDAWLYDICRATSAGPTYLPTYRFEYAKNYPEEMKHRNCIDGGIYVNNPSMAALAEVVKNLKSYDQNVLHDEEADFKKIFVLSIGTGTYSKPITDEESANKGLLYWAKNISELMMRGVNKTTDYEMEQMMEKGNYLRLKIDIDSDEHAEMSDSSRATADYLIGATKQQVLNNKETMQKLDAFLVRSGLKNTVPPAKENQPPFTMASSNPKTSPEIN